MPAGFPDSYTINFEVLSTSSFMTIPTIQQQPRENSLYWHHLDPGTYLLLPVWFGNGRSVRISTKSGMLLVFDGKVGWNTERLIMLTVPPGKTDWVRVQSGNGALFTQAEIDAGVNMALMVNRTGGYTP